MSGKITLSKVEKLIDCQLELTKYEFAPLWNAVPTCLQAFILQFNRMFTKFIQES
jgi:hypothetical protein